VSGRFSMPDVIRRRVWCPTWRITLTEVEGKAETYSANVVSWKGSHGALDARNSRSTSARPGRAGAAEKPQLPTISVVTPCRTFDSARGFKGRVKSEWVWMSMKPGATTCPCAEMIRRAGGEDADSM